ncbi:MAG: fluoride efflux transporter CrcB [Halobacteriovorax sp.]|nr:fluoride efflux transporter CrcB [Halobacteriovorax sp.]MEE3079528.1 CrcB family protein [Bdellovibrionota bacterium]|tara:strand:- start:3719 stop:4069 length:351 start_codon:yes stop_codon:yes gene_type:complete
MKDLALVFVGGGSGAILRFLTSKGVRFFMPHKMWLSTLIVNVVGSLIMVYLYKNFNDQPEAFKKMVQVGILGGLTTYSSFSLDIFSLVSKGSYSEALLVFLLNIMFGIVVGIFIFR